MIKSKAMQLVKALRSGTYHQGYHVLVNDFDEFCCLGVACDISETDLEWEKDDYDWSIGGNNGYLPTEVMIEFGFCSVTGHRRDNRDVIIDGRRYDDLASANDQGCTFEQIADYIEENWEAL